MIELIVSNRNLETKPNHLRSEGFTPGIIYGEHIKATPIKAKQRQLHRAIKMNDPVYKIPSSSGTYFAKIEEIQQDPVSGAILHFSLVELPKGEESEIEVPVELKGTPEGVQKGGTVLSIREHLKVTGKPKKIPEKIQIDVSQMKIGDKVLVDDLNIPQDIQLVQSKKDVVAVCLPPSKVSTQAPLVEEMEAAIGQ